jgi:DNA-binding MarR family transcriptional regulator
MDKALKEQYMRAIIRFRKIALILPYSSNLSINELVVMRGLEDNCPYSEGSINISEIKSELHITKSAISQMMNSLEKKGFIERKIDTNDRRKIVVTLTQTGKDILEETKKSANNNLNKIISNLGDENTKQLINLLNQVSDISEELKKGYQKNNKVNN